MGLQDETGVFLKVVEELSVPPVDPAEAESEGEDAETLVTVESLLAELEEAKERQAELAQQLAFRQAGLAAAEEALSVERERAEVLQRKKHPVSR